MIIKVCHLADHLNGKVDGIFTHIKMIVRNSDRSKFLHYLCFQGDKNIEEEIENLGGKVIILPEITSKVPIKAIIKFIRIVRSENIQIVHTHYLKPYIIAGFCNIFLKRKVIFNYHGIFIKNEYYNFIEKALFQIAHFTITKFEGVQLVLTPSKFSKKKLHSETKLFSKIISYYNGGNKFLDNNNLDNNIVSKIKSVGSFRLIYVGRIDCEKRVDRAIDIISQLNKENVNIHLFIFGYGDLLDEIRLQIERLNVQKLITFLGTVKNPKIYFKLFDTLILTSDREGLPLVIWEAMSQGLPIISTDVGGVKEIINDARCGLLFDKNNLKDGSLVIKRIIRDDYLKKSLGVNGLNAIEYKYNQANFDKQVDRIYSCLVQI